jgi:hypothetical protein
MELVTPIPALTSDEGKRGALLQEYAECGFLLRSFSAQVDAVLDDFSEKAVKVSKKSGKFTLVDETNKVYLFFFRDLMWWNFSSDASRGARAGRETWNHTDNCVCIDFREVDEVVHGGVRHSLMSLVSRGPHKGWPHGKDDFGRLSKTPQLTPSDVALCLSVIKAGRAWLDKAEALVAQCGGYAARHDAAKRDAAFFRKLLDQGERVVLDTPPDFLPS